jgi:dTDP-4-amino-4,6-dideoxygalactose transaminase
VLFDRMLVLGHYGRLRHGQAGATFDTDYLSLGLKFRPHLYAILLALGSLSRLEELNRRRQRNYDILCAELADCAALQPVPTAPHATRGGFLEFVLRFEPAHAGGWNTRAFVHAARAEGVPIEVERYARIGERGRMLHETPIFTTLDFSRLGGFLDGGRSVQEQGDRDLPVLGGLADRLVTMPAFTDVPERFVRECAGALRKVAASAAAMGERPAPERSRLADIRLENQRHGVLDAGSRAGTRVPARGL